MPTPFRHPGNSTHWCGHIGRGKTRRTRNLQVPLTEPIELAQAALDALTEEWESKQGGTAPKRPAQPQTERPLLDLFREYKTLKTLHYANSRRGFGNAAARVEKIIRACKFKRPSDIDAAEILAYIDSRRGPKFGASTAEHYRRDFRWFCNWLHEHGHLTRKVFSRRDRIKGELCHRRRVLTPAETRRLLEAAAAGPAYGRGAHRKTGADRRLIYWTALVSGFRSGELQSLTVASLQGDRLKLSGEHCKNGDDSEQPLTPDLAAALREYVRGRDPADRLFPRWGRGAKMLRVDLRAAGIPYRTPDGVADFHALRNAYITRLIERGVDIKTVHVLARHRTVSMTMSYARTDDRRKADAVGLLASDPVEWGDVPVPAVFTEPADPSPPARPDVLTRLFGSDNLPDLELLGQIEITDQGEVRLAFGPYAGERLCGAEEYGWEIEGRVNQEAINPAPEDTSPQDEGRQDVESAPRRTRTYNPLIKSASPEPNDSDSKGIGRAESRLVHLLIKRPTPALIAALVERSDLPAHIRTAVAALLSLKGQ